MTLVQQDPGLVTLVTGFTHLPLTLSSDTGYASVSFASDIFHLSTSSEIGSNHLHVGNYYFRGDARGFRKIKR